MRISKKGLRLDEASSFTDRRKGAPMRAVESQTTKIIRILSTFICLIGDMKRKYQIRIRLMPSSDSTALIGRLYAGRNEGRLVERSPFLLILILSASAARFQILSITRVEWRSRRTRRLAQRWSGGAREGRGGDRFVLVSWSAPWKTGGTRTQAGYCELRQ